MTQIQMPQQPQHWGAFLPQVTVQMRPGAADMLRPQGISQVSDRGPGFTTRLRTALGNPVLGQATGQATYQKAKAQVARFDLLAQREQQIANKTVRDQLAQEFGLSDPGNKDKAQYTRDALASEVAQAEKYSPVNYYFFESPGPQKRRPDTLASMNDDFESAVKDAEITYGVLPSPITNTITQTIQSPLTIPILVGAGVVGLALLLT